MMRHVFDQERPFRRSGTITAVFLGCKCFVQLYGPPDVVFHTLVGIRITSIRLCKVPSCRSAQPIEPQMLRIACGEVL